MPHAQEYLVLIVNGSVDQIEVLSAVLVDTGYRVMRTGCVRDSIQRAVDDRPDLVICEFTKGNLDGIALCREMRLKEELRDTPILLVHSQQPERSAVLEAIASGADDVVGIGWGLDYALAKIGRLAKVGRVVADLKEAVQSSWKVVSEWKSTARDVRERKSLEEQLRQAQKLEAVGRLAGGIAHDFNNCLTAIVGFGELLLREIDKGECNRSRLEDIMKAAARARSLTDQLLAYSRKQVLAPKVLNLNSSIAKMWNMLRRLIPEDIFIEWKEDPALGCVRADSGQIEQVILNLATNARDSMLQGGVLTIETHNICLRAEYRVGELSIPPGKYVVLAFSDTGHGMDEETRLRVFEPFYTTKACGKGTGLGLATVYSIVKESGGNIEVHSERGKGSTFKVYLPRVYEEADKADGEPEIEEVMGGGETILLVEDDDLVRAVARESLELVGYKVLEASSAAAAIELSEREGGEIDLLVTDVIMPGMSGLELAVRLERPRAGLRVLFMSGYPGGELLHEKRVESDLVEKPFTPQALARKVRDILAT